MSLSAITSTDFSLPGQTGVYHGKVRDMYSIGDEYLVAVATDRISAFDVILPRAIPFKGQVLNQAAAYFLEATKDIAPNWLRVVPDPNASIGVKCEPFKIEMVVRGCLVGHAWREYKDGARELCGEALPDGLQEYDKLPEPIITPSTKADEGHDVDISRTEILQQKLASETDYDKLSEIALKLFARGQKMAAKQGLLLADTKYEFGQRGGQIFLIDEVHTPDSSRYFYADSYDAFLKDRSKPPPKHLSKEFVREWLMANGFSGQSGQTVPGMDDELVQSISERYIELYEQVTGQKFLKPAAAQDPIKRLETNIRKALEQL